MRIDIISSYQSSSINLQHETNVDIVENKKTASESPEVEAYLARNKLIIAAEGLKASPILPEDVTFCISAIAGMMATIINENTEQNFSFKKYL